MERSFSFNTPTTLLLLLLFISNTAARAVPAAKTKSTTTEFIRNSCIATTYPTLCVSSLMDHASAIQTSPRLLADTALSVTLTSARSASAAMSSLLSRPGRMRPREVGAIRDCVENMGDSVDELRSSVAEMGHNRRPDIGMQMSDIQTWVSAALTEENTCMEGFAGGVMNGAVKTMVRNRIVNVAHLTSNALALINKLATTTQHSSSIP